jgi:hypothetical protein
MKMPFGKHKGMEISALPVDYLQWMVANFDPGPIRDEAERVLRSPELRQEGEAKSLEDQANALLGEKPVGLIRRGRRRR